MAISYSALKAQKTEPEYKKNPPPPLPISSVGTDCTTAKQGHLPYGSALMTDTLDGSGKGASTLNTSGITHIIHAAPKSEGEFTNRDDFIQNVVKAVQNCIILADREDIQQKVKIKKLAICFVGGGIFCDNESTKPILAESIIKGALNQVEECKNLEKIAFLSFKGDKDKAYYLADAWNEVKKEANFSKKMDNKAEIKKDADIRKKEDHGANVIVNAANTYVGFGGGISGLIEKGTGNSNAIDQKAQELIGEFYSLIKKEDNTEVSC
jgi:O-acetyl-ADP-ribose deacetylase (regulator of RNase III)